VTEDLIPGIEENSSNVPPEGIPGTREGTPESPERTREPRPEPSVPPNARTVDREALRRRERSDVAKILERAARRLERRGRSRSVLKPRLQQDRTLERTPGPKRRGRPPVLASWFKCVALAMGDGTPLKIALRCCGVTGLDDRQIRAQYRNREFRRMYQEKRNQHARDSYFKRLTREELLRRML
jgi:hypothetical protein